MKKKLEALETYRAFAALMIAALHFELDTPIVDHALARGSFVHFFFTLSGFVIYYNYHDKFLNIFDLKNFIKKRFLRLFPLHLFFLIIFLFIEIARYFVGTKFGITSSVEPFEKNNLYAFVSNIFLLQTFLDQNTFNGPSWSISAEFYTYLLFGLMILLRIKVVFFLLILILILIFRQSYGPEFGPQTTYFSFIDCIYCFLIGSIFCELYFKIKNLNFYKNFTSILVVLSILLVLFSIIDFEGNERYLRPFFFGILILFSSNLNKNSFLGKIICNSFFVFLGKISYSIYLSHVFIFWSTSQILRFIFKVDTYIDSKTGISKLDLDIFYSSFLAIILYILTILFSAATYKFIEKKYYK